MSGADPASGRVRVKRASIVLEVAPCAMVAREFSLAGPTVMVGCIA